MTFFRSLVVTTVGVFGYAAAHAAAMPITLYNTGVNNSGTALADGSTDPHYTLTVNPDGTGTGPLVQDSTAFPIVSGPWLADTAVSKWIGPRFNTSGSAGGTYDYTTTFTLPVGTDPASATISGNWAFDDGSTAAQILLNGTNVETGNNGFGSYTAFSIPAGNLFLPGVNTLTFEGINAGSYTGLRVDGINGTVNTPEPVSVGLLGLAGWGLLARRRRA